MKHKTLKKVVTICLVVAVLLSAVPMAVFAAIPNWQQNNVVYDQDTFGTNGYYNVISKKDYTLVPGAATETEMVINNAQGNRRNVMHIIEVDPSNPDVSILPGYYNIDKDLSVVTNQKAAGVTDVAKYYENELGFNVVAAMNTDLDYTDNAPRVLVYNGQDLAGYAGAAAPRSVLCVYKDSNDNVSVDVKAYSKAEIDNELANGHATRGQLLHAVSVSFAMTVIDGELVSKTEERTSEKAARSMVGVKEDGTLVLVMNDGRGANNSVGFNSYELGESMLALGCKWAANCDGGGSSSVVTKRAGEDETVCRCVPCDGAERPTKSSVIVVSNAAPTGVLNNVEIGSDYDYFAPGTTYTFDAEAIDSHGYAMDMPADAEWHLSDASFGTVNDGTFISNGTVGDVDVEVTSANTDVTDRTVIFSNNKNWENVNIYYWNGDSNNSWPGEPMTYLDTNNYGEDRYTFELPEGYTNFIINDGLGADNDGYQTNDLTFSGKTGIYVNDDNPEARRLSVGTYDISRKVVGSRTITVDNPASLTLSAASTVLPYSTAEKPRKVTLPIEAKTGEDNVYIQPSLFEITSSVANAGTIDDFVFTATTDESIASTVITAKYLPTNQELTYTVTFGKGSEILWDFEDGIDGWLGQQDAHDWQVAHGVTPFDEEDSVSNSLSSAGQMNASSRSRTFVSTVENGGKVHNGKQALGVEYDFRGADFNSWVYMILFNVLNENDENPDCVLRDTANGKNATSIGMWVYLPVGFRDDKNAGSLALQMNLFYKKADGSTGQAGINMQYKGKNINALTEADIPDSRWIYVKGNLPTHPYVALTDPLQSNYRAPSIFRMYVKPSVAQTLTYYYDDITLDYSDAVDDRDAPVISNPCYAYTDTAITINNGDTVPYYVDFSANAADFAASNASGIDPTSAAVYLDGVKFNNAGYVNGQIIAEDYPLSEGQHTVIFEISDNLGNIAQLKRTINCTSTNFQGLYLDGHNDSGSAPLAGSVYYLDLKAKNIENIQKIETTIDLQTANTWEAEHLEVADGFTASYTVNEAEPEFVTFTIERTGKVTQTGDQTLLAVPVRVWNWDESWPFGGDGTATRYGKTARYSAYGEPVLKVSADVVYGKVNYIQNAETTTASFGGTYSVDTVVDGNKTSGIWHDHDAELTTQNKEATCTESGYTDRKVCESCGSVVDWGTTIPAAGHNYEIVDGKFVCSVCADVYQSGTGLFEIDGKTYYSIAGKLISGWQMIDDDWYYFDSTTYTTVPTLNNGYVTFEFDGTGKLESGKWYNDGVGTKYYYGPGFHKGTPSADVWREIDGKTYCFDRNGHIFKNYHFVNTSNSSVYKWYDFGNDGVLVGEWDYTGPYALGDNLYYIENGLSRHGMFEMDGDIYYAGAGNYFAAIKNQSYYCRDNHKIMPDGTYTFGPEGKLLDNMFYTEDGVLYYYVGGVKAADVGTVVINGEHVIVDKTGKVIYTGYFTDVKGEKLYYVDGIETHVVKNGVIDGYFYENDVRAPQYAGLKEYEGDFYYVDAYGKVITNARKYVNKTNGLKFADGTDVQQTYYNFDADGKMIILNGIVDDYYYVNGAQAPAYYGLVKVDGDFYYVDAGGKIVKDARKYVNKSNDLTYDDGTPIPNTYFLFDEDGKMRVNDFILDDNAYIGGVKCGPYYGLIKIGDDFYYVDAGEKIIKNSRKYVNRTNGLKFADGTDVQQTYYEFDKDGKMIVKNGIIDDYYYINGAQAPAYYGLVEFEGNFYYVNDYGRIIKDARKFVNTTNGLKFADGTDVPRAYFNFDADGKMIID